MEYSETFFISANEGNPEGELAVTILVDQIIQIATAHANHLGIGNPDMKHLGAGWVLSRLTVDMEKYPKVNSSYKLTTWVEGWNRHFSVRDFCISSPEGEVYGYARSVWMVLDTATHENFGTSHLTLPEGAISERQCPIAAQLRHKEILPFGELTKGKNSLPASAESVKYRFKYNDIDFYRHVNTVKYVSLILNQFTLEEFDRYMPKRLELSFITEGKYGQTVDIRRHNDTPLLSSFSISSSSDNHQILFARLQLQPRS